jgi:hypothetical protein
VPEQNLLRAAGLTTPWHAGIDHPTLDGLEEYHIDLWLSEDQTEDEDEDDWMI